MGSTHWYAVSTACLEGTCVTCNRAAEALEAAREQSHDGVTEAEYVAALVEAGEPA